MLNDGAALGGRELGATGGVLGRVALGGGALDGLVLGIVLGGGTLGGRELGATGGVLGRVALGGGALDGLELGIALGDGALAGFELGARGAAGAAALGPGAPGGLELGAALRLGLANGFGPLATGAAVLEAGAGSGVERCAEGTVVSGANAARGLASGAVFRLGLANGFRPPAVGAAGAGGVLNGLACWFCAFSDAPLIGFALGAPPLAGTDAESTIGFALGVSSLAAGGAPVGEGTSSQPASTSSSTFDVIKPISGPIRPRPFTTALQRSFADNSRANGRRTSQLLPYPGVRRSIIERACAGQGFQRGIPTKCLAGHVSRDHRCGSHAGQG